MFDADTIILFARQECKGVALRHATSYKRAAEENIDRGVTTGQEKMYSSDEGKRNKLTSYTHSM